ncbi:hypothetical protein Ocin01_04286 [Orchesella cincta]|uniref:Uncharacterized protein n=1 Tax=Orchesella cincta TaxID=48709 RepID=A0A1D2NAX2_ORCCI|nr:hypothetical protein Ocin01_04286 [Orchesella cincta]
MPTWEDFKQKHVLNPVSHQGYESWNRMDQNNWLRHRLAMFAGNRGQTYGQKNLNSVIIATSQEILQDFSRPGVQYGPQEDFYWSNRQYPIWLFRKRGEDYSVTKLHERHGPMHFLARTNPRNGHEPIHFHAQDTTPSDTPRRY